MGGMTQLLAVCVMMRVASALRTITDQPLLDCAVAEDNKAVAASKRQETVKKHFDKHVLFSYKQEGEAKTAFTWKLNPAHPRIRQSMDLDDVLVDGTGSFGYALPVLMSKDKSEDMGLAMFVLGSGVTNVAVLEAHPMFCDLVNRYFPSNKIMIAYADGLMEAVLTIRGMTTYARNRNMPLTSLVLGGHGVPDGLQFDEKGSKSGIVHGLLTGAEKNIEIGGAIQSIQLVADKRFKDSMLGPKHNFYKQFVNNLRKAVNLTNPMKELFILSCLASNTDQTDWPWASQLTLDLKGVFLDMYSTTSTMRTDNLRTRKAELEIWKEGHNIAAHTKYVPEASWCGAQGCFVSVVGCKLPSLGLLFEKGRALVKCKKLKNKAGFADEQQQKGFMIDRARNALLTKGKDGLKKFVKHQGKQYEPGRLSNDVCRFAYSSTIGRKTWALHDDVCMSVREYVHDYSKELCVELSRKNDKVSFEKTHSLEHCSR